MHAARTARPVTTIRPAPAAPKPEWSGLFLEPVYTDGKPYAADDGLEDNEHDAA